MAKKVETVVPSARGRPVFELVFHFVLQNDLLAERARQVTTVAAPHMQRPLARQQSPPDELTGTPAQLILQMVVRYDRAFLLQKRSAISVPIGRRLRYPGGPRTDLGADTSRSPVGHTLGP